MADTLIIGNKRYDIPTDQQELINSANDILSQIKAIAPLIQTEENYDAIYSLIDDVEDLLDTEI